MTKIVDIKPYLREHLSEKMQELSGSFNEDVAAFNASPDPTKIPELEYRQAEILDIQRRLSELEA